MQLRQSAATWLVAQCEPLVPTLDRAVAEQAFIAATTQNLEWATWWFGGLIADHVQSLPTGDPWRHLSARAGDTLTRGRLPKPPALTGAVGPNGKFGTLEDCTDLAHPSFSDPSTDIGLAAVAGGISNAGAALLAFGADGARECQRAAMVIYTELTVETRDPESSASKLFGACVDATRWALWRRRAYVGLADDWTLASGFAWLWRAEELAAHGDLPAGEWEEAARALADATIDPDTYAVITGA